MGNQGSKTKAIKDANDMEDVDLNVVDEEDEEEIEECELILSDSEAAIMTEIIAERRMHRDALSNLHQRYKREDARRILENLPYKQAEFIPVVRERHGRHVLIWMADTIDGLIQDLKLKFNYYDSISEKSKTVDAHDLLKKVESQKKAVK